jgi:predicted O-methyltransferase YrrM
MNDSIKYIYMKYGVDINQRQQPVEIPNTTRETLASLLRELGLNKGVEVGVEAGIYSEVLCKANPNIELYCVDAWTAYKGYRDHVTQFKLDNLLEITRTRMAQYNATVMQGFSMDVVKQFPDNSLDFVYIDGNHEFQHVVNDVAEWSKKVRAGGIVAGHDYIRRRENGYLMHVPQAIHGYIDSYNIRPLFVLGRKAKIEGEARDNSRSWFYFKPEPVKIVKGSGDKILT